MKNKVDWDANSKKVSITKDGEGQISKIELTIGTKNALVYDKDIKSKEVALEVPEKIVDGSLYLYDLSAKI